MVSGRNPGRAASTITRSGRCSARTAARASRSSWSLTAEALTYPAIAASTCSRVARSAMATSTFLSVGEVGHSMEAS